MKKEQKKVVLYETVYIAFDGTEFSDESECKSYEATLTDYKECPDCHGTGKVDEVEHYDNYHTGAPETTTVHVRCKRCNGKGYLKKTIKWE